MWTVWRNSLLIWAALLTAATYSDQDVSGTEGWMKKLPWYDAYLQCQSHRASLPVAKATDFRYLERLLPRDGSRIWVGGRYVHSPWKWTDGCEEIIPDGCAMVSEVLRLSSRQLKTEDPFQCLTACGSPFVAIQKTACYCLKSHPEELVERSFCNLRCAANFDQTCGSMQNYATVYAYQQNTIPWDTDVSRFHGDCAFLYLPRRSSASLDDLRMRADLCNPAVSGQYRQFLCEVCSPGSGTCDVKRHIQYMTWFHARQVCQEEGGQLLTVRGNKSLPLLMHPYHQEEFWIGLKRDFVLKWINGSEVVTDGYGDGSNSHPFKIDGGFCLAAHRGDNNNVQLVSIDCSSELPYVCDSASSGDAGLVRRQMDQPSQCKSAMSPGSTYRPRTDADPTTSPQASIPSPTPHITSQDFITSGSLTTSPHHSSSSASSTTADTSGSSLTRTFSQGLTSQSVMTSPSPIVPAKKTSLSPRSVSDSLVTSDRLTASPSHAHPSRLSTSRSSMTSEGSMTSSTSSTYLTSQQLETSQSSATSYSASQPSTTSEALITSSHRTMTSASSKSHDSISSKFTGSSKNSLTPSRSSLTSPRASETSVKGNTATTFIVSSPSSPQTSFISMRTVSGLASYPMHTTTRDVYTSSALPPVPTKPSKSSKLPDIFTITRPSSNVPSTAGDGGNTRKLVFGSSSPQPPGPDGVSVSSQTQDTLTTLSLYVSNTAETNSPDTKMRHTSASSSYPELVSTDPGDQTTVTKVLGYPSTTPQNRGSEASAMVNSHSTVSFGQPKLATKPSFKPSLSIPDKFYSFHHDGTKSISMPTTPAASYTTKRITQLAQPTPRLTNPTSSIGSIFLSSLNTPKTSTTISKTGETFSKRDRVTDIRLSSTTTPHSVRNLTGRERRSTDPVYSSIPATVKNSHLGETTLTDLTSVTEKPSVSVSTTSPNIVSQKSAYGFTHKSSIGSTIISHIISENPRQTTQESAVSSQSSVGFPKKTVSGFSKVMPVTSVSQLSESSGLVTDHVMSTSPRTTVILINDDGETPDDLTPLYIVLGTLAGLIIITIIVIVIVVVFKFRSTRRFAELKSYEGSSAAGDSEFRADTYRTRSAMNMLRSEHVIEVEDTHFRFVEHED